MKKQDLRLKNTKLRLSRETLLALEQSDLVFVEGGATTLCSENLGSCNGCDTRNTCTSRYC